MPDINYKNPRPKDKRILKAHRKRHIENKGLDTIAEELGISYSTVKKYFTESSKQRIEQLYSEEEKEFLRLQLFHRANEASERAENYVGRAVSDEQIRPNELLRAAKEEQEIPLRYAEMLQELGIIEKKPDKEIHRDNGNGESVEDRLAEAYQQKMQEHKNGEEDREEVLEA